MTIDRRSVLLATLAAGVTGPARAQTAPPTGATVTPGLMDPSETIDLWPKGAPGMPATPPVEAVTERSKDPNISDRAVTGIVRPRMVVFRPAIPNGSALMIAPGGGYVRVVVDKEGYEMGRWLAARGWTVFVLFYRLPGEGWKDGANVALADAQRAMRLIRHRAQAYGIQPDRVGAMGFSAGGHVCGDLATRFDAKVYDPVDAADKLSARPDIAAPIYGVQSMAPEFAHPGSREVLLGKDSTPALERLHSPSNNVTKATPPCFLVHAEDDPVVPVDNSIQFRAALKAAGVKVETHLFTNGGHGFGLRFTPGKPVAAWPDLFVHWAQSQGLG